MLKNEILFVMLTGLQNGFISQHERTAATLAKSAIFAR